MAKVSRETASHVEDIGVLESRSEEVDGTTIEFTSFREDADATPFFVGLPDGRCQSRHWGYVLQGRVTFRYADRDPRSARPHPGRDGRHRARRVQPDRRVREDTGRARAQPRGGPDGLSD